MAKSPPLFVRYGDEGGKILPSTAGSDESSVPQGRTTACR